MKQLSLNLITLVLVTVFNACSKEKIEKPLPQPGQPVNSSFRIVIDNLPAAGQSHEGLYAIATVTNEQEEAVMADRKLPLTLDGKYSSAELKLPAGKYKLTKFVVFGKDNKVMFAAPRLGSDQAAGVQKPLSAAFSLPTTEVLAVKVEVLFVIAGEQPSHYGYPAGTFNEQPGGPAPDNNPNFRIKLKTVISNGNVVYDSIASLLKITTWDERNEWSSRELQLEPGTNDIILPKSALKFKFQVWKWGHTDEMTLLRQDLDSNTVYTIGGRRAAKRLKSELVYTLVSGAYKAESKNEFIYGPNGKLNKIIYRLKRKDGTPYIANTEDFNYSGDRVESTVKSDEFGNFISFTTFQYDAQGKLVDIRQTDNSTGATRAAVSYQALDGSFMIQARYGFSTGMMLNSNMTMTGGNMVKLEAATANGNSETGLYQYDFNINPYANMGWPDLMFSRNSKNNLTGQQKTYHGSFPTADPYSFEYKYDDFGYPLELIKSFKSPTTGQHLFTTKTVYNYY
ncbi:hypothetical protein [Flavihumibacter solisilvae]|uniref:Uncharacterized protein n=1 Tax=Flavihumibacter solisilvae TaxID=1349421 RepID=A0A0C1L1T8_9BACT|nr:hypothetical protein [Flavihumibacter solisilvae]KIC93972.1 hypothetical protein OI18_13105 [Flavihumibacter solisilvae]